MIRDWFVRKVTWSKLLRIFLLARYSRALRVLGSTLYKSRQVIMQLFIMKFIVALTLASAVYIAENSVSNEGVEPQIDSVFSGLWYSA